MLSRDRMLGVGEPQLVRHASERIAQTRDCVQLAGTRTTQQLLCGLAVMLQPLDGGKRVIDFTWWSRHDCHLHLLASAIELEEGVSNNGTNQLSRGGNIPLRGPVATSLAATRVPQGRPSAAGALALEVLRSANPAVKLDLG